MKHCIISSIPLATESKKRKRESASDASVITSFPRGGVKRSSTPSAKADTDASKDKKVSLKV